MICSSDGFLNILTHYESTKLNVLIYIHSYTRISKHTQFHEKNRRLVVSKFVKLSDELIISQKECRIKFTFLTNVFVSDALRKMFQNTQLIITIFFSDSSDFIYRFPIQIDVLRSM